MIAALASDSPRLNVLFQTYIASQRIGALLDRHLEAAVTTSDTVKVGPLPFVARRGFGDMWISNFGGFAVWRLRAG